MATLKCDGVSQTSDISKRNQVALVSHQLTERRSGVNGVFDNNDLDVIAGSGLLHLICQLTDGDQYLGLAVDQLAPDLPGGVEWVEGGEDQPCEDGMLGRRAATTSPCLAPDFSRPLPSLPATSRTSPRL